MKTANTNPDIYCFEHNIDGSYAIQFFEYAKEHKHRLIGGTEIGDMFHVVFFKDDKDGNRVIDDKFEAIFSDPLTYLKRLKGTPYYGMLARKTVLSSEIFDDLIEKVMRKNGKSVSK